MRGAIELSKKIPEVFRYQKGREIYRILLEDIVYFDVYKKEVTVITIDGSDSFRGSLKGVVDQLPSWPFVQLNRSQVANYEPVTRCRISEWELDIGTHLTISRDRQKEIRALLLDIGEVTHGNN